MIAAFNYSQDNFDLPSPLKGLKKPAAKPRLHSLSKADEEVLFSAIDPAFRDFLLATIHTGLRPFCELAKMTADDVEEATRGRGLMWRVYSSETKRTRKISVRPGVAKLTRRMISRLAGLGPTAVSDHAGPDVDPEQRGRPVPESPSQTRVGYGPSTAAVLVLLADGGEHLGAGGDPAYGLSMVAVLVLLVPTHVRPSDAEWVLWNGGVGCSVETLAELIGDTPKVGFDHYGREWEQHYQDPLWNAIGVNRRSMKK